MGPNPVLGTDVGKAYAGQEGTGFASVLGPSRAADTYVTMRREELAFQRQQEAQRAAEAAKARKEAMNKLMEVPDHYVKYDQEVLALHEEMLSGGSELLAEDIDPFAPSKDPRVPESRKKYNNLKLAAETSLIIKEYDKKIQEQLAEKDADIEYDVESYQAEREKFFNRPLSEIAKDAGNFPVLQSRYGAIDAVKDLSAYHTIVTKNGEPMTEQQAYEAALTYVNDPEKKKMVDALVKQYGGDAESMVARASESGTRNIAAQVVMESLMGMSKKAPTYLDKVQGIVDKFEYSETPWGTDEKANRKRAKAIAEDIVANDPTIMTYKDIDGKPLVDGANGKEVRSNMVQKLENDIMERLKVVKRDPLLNQRYAESTKENPTPLVFADFKAGVIAGDPAAMGSVQGQKLADGTTVESVKYIPAQPGPTVGKWEEGSWEVTGFIKDPNSTKDKMVPVTRRFYSDNDFQVALQNPWEKEKKAKTYEATQTTTSGTWEDVTGGGGSAIKLN